MTLTIVLRPGKVMVHLRGDELHFRLRLLERNAILQPCQTHSASYNLRDPVVCCRASTRLHRYRNPDVGHCDFRAAKILRCDSHNGEALSI